MSDNRDAFTKWWDETFGNYRGSAADKQYARAGWEARIPAAPMTDDVAGTVKEWRQGLRDRNRALTEQIGNARFDELYDYAADAIAHIERLSAQLAEANGWREAVIDALVVAHIYRAEHDGDPRKALMDLLAWETQVALDPRVSVEAAKLRDTYLPEKTALVDLLAATKEPLIPELHAKCAKLDGELSMARQQLAERDAQVAERDAEIARLKMENSKLRSALEIVHFKREPWQ